MTFRRSVHLFSMKVYPFSHFPPIPDVPSDGAAGRLNEEHLNVALFRNDTEFDWLYPEHLQLMALKQWTPLAAARKAAGFLAEPGTKILDIGSGIGKFCLAGAYHYPETYFCGIEQRQELVHHAQVAKAYTQLPNVNFIHANMTQVNFEAFDHFYFYNAFFENVDPANRIDDTIELSAALFNYYSQYLCSALERKLPGTRMVTYHSSDLELPSAFRLVDTACNGLMEMWIKY